MGGNAFKQAGAICKSEIIPTFRFIRERVANSYNFAAIGSAGKKDFSSDLDIAIDVPADNRMDFYNRLRSVCGDHEVRKFGSTFSALMPILGYNNVLETTLPRTGFVQVDFIMGDVEWFEFFYFAAGSEISEFKGAHRNIAISTVCEFTNLLESAERTETNRPLEIERWKWSPNDGLVRVNRKLVKMENGNYRKKADETFLSVPTKVPETIAVLLFGDDATVDDLSCLESIVAKVKTTHTKQVQDRLFEKLAKNFAGNRILGKQQWPYPEEILKYMEQA